MKLEQLYWELTPGLLKARGIEAAPEWGCQSGIAGGDALCLRRPQKDGWEEKEILPWDVRVVLPRVPGEDPLYVFDNVQGKGVCFWLGEMESTFVEPISCRYYPASGVDQSEDYPEWFERVITRSNKAKLAGNFNIEAYPWLRALLDLLS